MFGRRAVVIIVKVDATLFSALRHCVLARPEGPHGSAKQGRDHFGLLFWRLHTSSSRC